MSESVAGLADSWNPPPLLPIATVSAVDAEGAKRVSPPYCAVMEWLPAASELLEKVATPEVLSVPVPKDVVPSRKVTVPVGMAVPEDGGQRLQPKVLRLK
jgi:hypothetical protein